MRVGRAGAFTRGLWQARREVVRKELAVLPGTGKRWYPYQATAAVQKVGGRGRGVRISARMPHKAHPRKGV